jgi:hypothetical protein
MSQQRKPSKRFQSTPWIEKIVPLLLILLSSLLVGTMVLLALALLGLLPSA